MPHDKYLASLALEVATLTSFLLTRAFETLLLLPFTDPKVIEIIGPPLRHAYTLFPMRSAMIGGTNPVPLAMRQGAIDRIWVPKT